MEIDWRRNNSLTSFFYKCDTCELDSEVSIEDFIDKELQKILKVKAEKLNNALIHGNIKFYESRGFPALQFRKDVGTVESGTVVYFGEKIEVVRGFPKIRRTLILSPAVENHFNNKIAVEEKMNGYNVRIASIDHQIFAFTRGGYVCPFTTKKTQELMDLDPFFEDNPNLVICGEMIGTENPYVSHYYPEIGELGFRIFDVREKISNQPLTIHEKFELIERYNLPPVRLFGFYDVDKAAMEVKRIIKKLGEEGREGLVIKDVKMEEMPLKYTASQAHDREIRYAFKYPFDFGRAFFFSRVIREGFQAFEMNESHEELKERAQRLGESILMPMVQIISHVSQDNPAAEDLVIGVDSKDEAEEFVRFLHDLGVNATLIKFKDGKAVIRRIHQATTDKITNYLKGGLY
ncbi:MAG: RNA ligase [Methanobacterium sp. BRmetb2]|nr:MAG: RNA ligase [Methanobacterium sp. BRmetb2]